MTEIVLCLCLITISLCVIVLNNRVNKHIMEMNSIIEQFDKRLTTYEKCLYIVTKEYYESKK